MLNFELGVDGQMHAVPSDTQRKGWERWKKDSTEAEVNFDRSGYARNLLNQTLPIQLLLDFPQWFAVPGTTKQGVDINEALLEQHQGELGQFELFVPLVSKVFGLRHLSVQERQDNLNPWRANNAINLKVAVFETLLDDDRFVKQRMSDGEALEIIQTSKDHFGVIAEQWIGKEAFRGVAEAAFSLFRIVTLKKRIGQRHEIALAKMPSIEIMQKSKREALLREIELTSKHMLVPELVVRKIYRLGELTRMFLGDKNDEIGRYTHEPKRSKLLREVLGNIVPI